MYKFYSPVQAGKSWGALFCLFIHLSLFSPASASITTPTRYQGSAGPAGLAAQPSLVGAITVKWDAVSGASRYVIEQSMLPDRQFVELATVAAVSGKTVYTYRDTGLGAGETYYYRVKAVTGSGETAFSNPVSATTHAAGKVFNIMPVGDSNTHGTKYNDVRPDAQRIAYRKQLYDLLMGAGARFSYVGSERSGSQFLANDQHAGFSGSRTGDILSLLRTSSYRNQANEPVSRGTGTYLDKYQPDVVLLHLGTNGGQWGVTDDDQTIAEMAAILDEVDAYERRANKEVTVILGLIINRVRQENDPAAVEYTSRYNQKLAAMAENRIRTKSDRLLVVDMEKAAGIIYSFPYQGGDMDDSLHPAPSGYQKMANTWFQALEPLLKPAAGDNRPPETTITQKPDAITNQKTATFAFSSNESRVYYEVSLNGAAFAAVSNPITYQNLEDGEYTLQVRAVDAAGNKDATPASHTWVVITRPPNAPVLSSVTEDRGPSDSDQVTSDNTLRLSGSAQSGVMVEISEAGRGVLGTVQANATGSWTFSYEGTALPEGAYRFTALATDVAGNKSAPSAVFPVTIDMTRPDVAITTQAKAPVREAFQVELKFTEEVYGLTAADLTVTNGTLSNFREVNRSTYTVTLTPPAGGEGTAAIALAAGKVTDLAGNPNTAPAKLEVAYDQQRPTLVLSSDAPQLVKGPFTVTFTFDEAVTGFTAEDISAGNAAVRDFTAQSSTVYTARIVPAADGEVNVHVPANRATDAAGNGNEASAVLKRLYDVAPPTVTLAAAAADPTNKPFEVTLRFSEPITGLTLQSFTLSNGRVSDLKKVDDTNYTVLLAPERDGEVNILLQADAVKDLAENGNTASNVLKRQYDATSPSLVLSTEAPELINAPFTVTFRFSEEVQGFEGTDISLSNGSAGNFRQINAREYSAVITPEKDGPVTVQVGAGKAQDAATNPNTASNTLRLRYDATPPAGYAVRFDTEKVVFDNQKEVAFTVTGAEAGATYFYTISSEKGGTPLTGSATTTTASFTLKGIDVSGLNDGTLTLTFHQVDAAGNKGQQASARVEKMTKNIVAVSTPAQVRVPFRTTFGELPLPARVEVSYSNGEKEQLEVKWQQGSYNGLAAGPYTLTGELVLKPNTGNQENRRASIVVVVEPNRPPTALALSATSFRPEARPDEVLATITTTDPDDQTHTYALVAGQGGAHNHLFEIREDKLYLKTNAGLSGTRNFNIRVRTTDPYQNTLEQSFTLSKSVYQPANPIKLVNAFSPDNDGINDTWTVPELKFYDEVSIQVFDRAGVRLFHTTNPEEGWDGRGRDGQVKQGSYFYIIEVKDIDLVQKGVLTVLK